MKEQNIDSLIDELLGGAKVEAPVETSITKEASEPTTRNTVPKVTTNGITVVYDTPEPQSQNADPKEENKDKAIEFVSKAAEMGLEEAQKELEEIQSKDSTKANTPGQSTTPEKDPPIETKPTQSNQVSVSDEKEHNNHRITWLIIILLLLGVAGGGLFYYLPQKRDAEAPRYYTFANSVRMRSSADFDVEYNKLESFSYGTEVIVYDSVPGNYFYGKVAPKDARGKVIKDRVVEGYMAYQYLLPKEDFFRLNGVFGNEEAKEMLSESRYRRALLNYLKSHNYCGKITAEEIAEHNLNSNLNNAEQWQVFCKDKASKSNTVYRSRKYSRHSKYPDLAVIIKNVRSSERRLLYFIFDDKTEAPELRGEQAAPAQGYMVDGTLTLQDWGHDGVDVYVRYTN